MRLIIVGLVLIAGAVGFFLFMMSIAHKSNDPATMMKIVGQAAGVVCGVSLAMIIVGLIGKKT